MQPSWWHFGGTLRISELVAGSHRDSFNQPLQLADVHLGLPVVQLLLCFSKTDQLGRGTLISLAACADLTLCPVTPLCHLLAVRGQEAGYLFIHWDGTPLTKFQFWSVTRRALDRIGLSGCQFGTHSFQIGAASTATAMGYHRADIESIGRWQSPCYKGYVCHCKV